MRVSRNGTSRLTHVELEMPTVLPDGPRSAKESLEWMPHIWPRMSCDQRYRLVKNMRRLLPSSHYSGTGCFEQILWEIKSFLFNKGIDVGACNSTHASDISEMRRRVLLSLSPEARPEHIHGNMKSRLPTDVLETF